MTESLLFLLGASPQSPLRWGRVDGARLVEGGWLESVDDLAGLVERAGRAQRVIGLLPGEQVATRRTATVPRLQSKARAAASYLMEDELAEAADLIHVAVASAGETGLAIAVKLAIIDVWLAAFSSAGVALDILSADYLALSPAAESARVIFENGRVTAAFDGVGLSVESDLFTMIAPRLFKTPPLRIEALGDAGLRRLLPMESEIDWLGSADDAHVLAFYASAIGEAMPANLLQGRYARKRALAPVFMPWRRAAAIAAAAGGVFAIGVIAEGVRAEQEARRWTKAAQEMHAERFPEQASEDAVEHARRLLAQGGGESSFLALASRFGEAVQKHEEVSLDRIRFNAAGGEFIVSIRSKTDVGIEQFKATLSALGVDTQDRGGYRRAGDQWSGELAARFK
jgi:general secretion pathway protein L